MKRVLIGKNATSSQVFVLLSLLLSSEDVAAVESVFLGSCYAFSNIEGRDNCFWFEIYTEREIT